MKDRFTADPKLTSYSQFLSSKRKNMHYLSKPCDDHLDFDFFHRSISFHYQHVYAQKKWQNNIYRCIFFGLSFLFIALGILIFYKTTNHVCGLYFSNCVLLKNCINISCLFLAGGSFLAGYTIHPEKEAFQFLLNKIERELSHPPKHLQLEFNAIFANLSHDWQMSTQESSWYKNSNS